MSGRSALAKANEFRRAGAAGALKGSPSGVGDDLSEELDSGSVSDE